MQMNSAWGSHAICADAKAFQHERGAKKDNLSQEVSSSRGLQQPPEQLLKRLLWPVMCSHYSRLVHALQGKLRIGLGEESVVSALAHAQLLHRDGGEDADGALANRLERAVQAVKQAVSQCPSYDVLIPALLKYPLEVNFYHWLLLVCASIQCSKSREILTRILLCDSFVESKSVLKAPLPSVS